METYSKTDENKLKVVTNEVKQIVSEHSLEELIKIRESIDISEAESMVMYQAEKDKYDTLIAEAKKLGVKTEEEIAVSIETDIK